jgi:SAM-dependent methyltransferase
MNFPWYVKIGAKVILSNTPLRYGCFRRIGIFRHGSMDSAAYSLQVFQDHLKIAENNGVEDGFTVLEIGPGDSVASALFAASLGASRIWLIDSGAYATTNMQTYCAIADYAISNGLTIPQETVFDSIELFLQSCRAKYYVDGLESLKKLADSSVDFIWSHAVLEHIRVHEFSEFIVEMYRVLRPGGVASHRVDLQDHLSGGLNNLRFSNSIWESDLMSESGFYTNRIRYQEMLDVFSEAGFENEVIEIDRWPELPLSKNLMNSQFQSIAIDELCVRAFSLVATKK